MKRLAPIGKILVLAVVAAGACPSVCPASVFSAKIRRLQFVPARQDYSRGLDLSKIEPVEESYDLTSADVAKVIPTDLAPGVDTGTIASKIISRSMQVAMNSDAIKQSSIGSAAASVQNSIQSNISIGNSREPNSVQHDFKFAVQPTQTKAMIHYSGLTTAELSYRASESKMNLEVREPMNALSTDLVFNHVNLPGDRQDVMSLRWAW